MKYKQLAITLIFLISFAVPITSVQAENEIKPFEISPPSEFDIEENDRDLLLGWESVDKAEEYKVYWSDDRAAQFPMEWNAETIMDTTWTHEGALDTDESIFYLVRGVNGTIEGELSHMGYKAEMDLLNRKDERSWNWLSLPYHVMDYNNDDEYTAMDLVEMIEGDRESSDIINSVARYNNSKPYESPKYDPYYNPSYYPIMNYTEDGWKIEDDFKIRIGDAIGLNTTANYTWNLCGVEDLNIDINIYDHSRQYVSIPYTTHDINQDGKIGTFDIVKDIEGNFSSSDYISTVFDWDASGQGFTNTTSYDAISGLWYDEFYFKPGDCASFHVRKDFTWKPFKTVHQPPMINNVIQNTSSVALDSSLTIEFTEKMNRTSLETNIDSNDFDLSLEWINNHTLEINPNQKFRPETEYALIITHLAKDIYGNYLDGDLNGIANRTDQDDYVLTFTSETYPMIEHDSPETWHIRDDIELSANITDDEGLENAYINYTQVDGIQHNVSLDVDNSTISIPAQNQTGTFSYYYWAVDESGLSNRSETFSIELLDLDDPYVMNVSQDSDVLSIYGNFTLEFSKPMNGTSVEDGLVITPDLNYDLTQIDEYRFEVNITAVPNQQYSINLDSQVAEDELGINLDSDFNTTFNTETSPDIVYEQEVFSIHKDSNISFSVECIDDFGVDNVQIEGTGPNGYTFAENLSDTGETWNIVLPRPNRTGQLDYRFIAEDSSGLLTYSENYSISILNPTEIRFKNVTGETDESFEFEIEITNPLGISDVELHYKENGMETVEDLTLTEGNAGDGLWTTQLDLDSEGEYEYSVVVTDLDGESVIEHSNKNIAVQESQSIFSNPFLYLLLIIVIAASTGGILYNRRDIGENIHEEETTSEQTEEESEDETEDTDKNLCTICFGEIEENIHICECGKKYHRSCINAIGECPICGNDNLKEGVENGGE